MRGPCWTCRSRTIQCDQSRFPCLKCEKAGLECFDKRPLRWVKGVAIRGKMRGLSFEGASGAFNNLRFARQRRSQPLLDSATRSAANIGPCPALQDSRIHNLDRLSRFYIDYYNKRICKLYILYDSDSNPFRNLLPYALEDSALRKSIVALAARHFANTGHSFDQVDADISPQFVNANLDALFFKKQTLEALSLSLSHAEHCKTTATWATILLLIFLDLLESGIDGWSIHLQGAKGLHIVYKSLVESDFSSHFDNVRGETAHEIRQFIAKQLSLIETLGSALSFPTSCFTPVLQYSVEDKEDRHQESIVRSFLGCPQFILRAVRFFSDQRIILRDIENHDDILAHENVRDTVEMLELTEKFDSFAWASNFQRTSSSSTTDINKLCMLSQAYQSAALLYGREVLGTSRTAKHENEELVSRLLGLIEALKGDAALFKCLIWPTFIVGIGCWAQSQRTFVTESLRLLWDSTGCLNVINASKILRDHWERKDQQGTPMRRDSDIDGLDSGWLLI
ncbi:uncharacterized protein N7477_007020 [Penicillium maclennaniae]|uniref:uncharacterized protein n=1 Tax=Penicillium maclennaniae TaxID=1343394 RepID=UPI002540E7DF|nr:uncharacterized protein N7477_007020 [Penicillium maclennaniae]KAJ5668450.1 hypothetical protein N7477_007020 [Penicillium maclennaniae]